MRLSRILLALGISAGALAYIPDKCRGNIIDVAARMGDEQSFKNLERCCLSYGQRCDRATLLEGTGLEKREDLLDWLPDDCKSTCSSALESFENEPSQNFDDLIAECKDCVDTDSYYAPPSENNVKRSQPTASDGNEVTGPSELSLPPACEATCSGAWEGTDLNNLEDCLQCIFDQALPDDTGSAGLHTRDVAKGRNLCKKECKWHGVDTGPDCILCNLAVANAELGRGPGSDNDKRDVDASSAKPLKCKNECAYTLGEESYHQAERCFACLDTAIECLPACDLSHAVDITDAVERCRSCLVAHGVAVPDIGAQVLLERSASSHTHHHHGRHSSDVSILTRVGAPTHSYPTSVLDCPDGAENCVLGNARFTKSAMPSGGKIPASIWSSVGMDSGMHWHKTQEDGHPYTKAKRQLSTSVQGSETVQASGTAQAPNAAQASVTAAPGSSSTTSSSSSTSTFTLTVLDGDIDQQTVNIPSVIISGQPTVTQTLKVDGTDANGNTLYAAHPEYSGDATVTQPLPIATTSTVVTGSGTATQTLALYNEPHLETFSLTADDGRTTVLTRADLGSTHVTLQDSTDAAGTVHLVSNVPFTWPPLTATPASLSGSTSVSASASTSISSQATAASVSVVPQLVTTTVLRTITVSGKPITIHEATVLAPPQAGETVHETVRESTFLTGPTVRESTVVIQPPQTSISLSTVTQAGEPRTVRESIIMMQPGETVIESTIVSVPQPAKTVHEVSVSMAPPEMSIFWSTRTVSGEPVTVRESTVVQQTLPAQTESIIVSQPPVTVRESSILAPPTETVHEVMTQPQATVHETEMQMSVSVSTVHDRTTVRIIESIETPASMATAYSEYTVTGGSTVTSYLEPSTEDTATVFSAPRVFTSYITPEPIVQSTVTSVSTTTLPTSTITPEPIVESIVTLLRTSTMPTSYITLEPVVEDTVTLHSTSTAPTSWVTPEPVLDETVTEISTTLLPTTWITADPVAAPTVTKVSFQAPSTTWVTITQEPVAVQTVTITNPPFGVPTADPGFHVAQKRNDHLPECFNDQLKFGAGYLGDQQPILGQVMWPWPLPPFQHWMQPGGHAPNASEPSSPLWPRIWGGIADHEFAMTTNISMCANLPMKTEYSTIFDAPMSGASFDYDRTTTVGAVRFEGRTINLPASITQSLSQLWLTPAFDKTKTVTMVKADNTVYSLTKSKGKYGTHSYSIRPPYDATKTVTGVVIDGHTHFPGKGHHVVEGTKYAKVAVPQCTEVIEVMDLGICGGTRYNVFVNTITRPPIATCPTETKYHGMFAKKKVRESFLMDKCICSYTKPINYTTVRSVMMPDPYEEGNYGYFNATYLTSVTREHWGVSNAQGAVWPISVYSTYHNRNWTTSARFVYPDNMDQRSRLGLADSPDCFDKHSCTKRCHDQAHSTWLWQFLLLVFLPVLALAMTMAALLGLCMPRLRARRNNRLDEKHNQATQTVVTTHDPATGSTTSTVVTSAVVGGAAGSAASGHSGGAASGGSSGGAAGGASGGGSGAGAGTAAAAGAGAGAGAAAGGDGRGTQRRAAEEGRQPKGVRFDEKSGTTTTTAPVAAHPGQHDGAAERTGSEVFDVGSMRGRKRNRGEEGNGVWDAVPLE